MFTFLDLDNGQNTLKETLKKTLNFSLSEIVGTLDITYFVQK